MGFQTAVNLNNPIAVAGDFASANPRASAFAGEGGLIAGAGGVTVGKFAWIAADGITVTNVNPGAGAPSGFVHREQQALITGYLQESGNVIPQGFPVTLHTSGDFFAIANGAAATLGAAVYAHNADGSAYIGADAAGVVTKFVAKSAAAIGGIFAMSTWGN